MRRAEPARRRQRRRATACALALLVVLTAAAPAPPAHASAGASTGASRSGESDAQQVHDDFGRPVPVRPMPMRVASLAPHATELAVAAGLGPSLVAVDLASDRPAAAVAGLARIAALPEPDREALLRIAPDLVLLWGAGLRPGVLERLQADGLRVFVSAPRRLEDIADTIERLGSFSPHPERARARALALRGEFEALRAGSAQRTPVPVFYQVWSRPLMTLSDRDLIGDAIRACGGRNVFAEAPLAAFSVDREAVLARRPALVIVADQPQALAAWESAVAAGRIARAVYLAPDSLQRPSPGILDGLGELCAAIEDTRGAMAR